jgi:hypothetical protein
MVDGNMAMAGNQQLFVRAVASGGDGTQYPCRAATDEEKGLASPIEGGGLPLGGGYNVRGVVEVIEARDFADVEGIQIAFFIKIKALVSWSVERVKIASG